MMDKELLRLVERYFIKLGLADKKVLVMQLVDAIVGQLHTTGLKVVTDQDVEDIKDLIFVNDLSDRYRFTAREILSRKVEQLKAERE